MPSQLFYSTGIPVSLWFISRNKAQKGKTVFIDARNLGTMVTRKLRELMPDTDIKKSLTPSMRSSREPWRMKRASVPYAPPSRLLLRTSS